MFDEKEPGKPQNWGWTIGIIMVICILNLGIFVVIRVILDSENEFDEPLVQGELRQNLTKFLGIFALSFSFGCWCCFCCMGNCFKWATCCFHEQTRESVSNCWSSYLKHQHTVVESVSKKSSSIFVTPRRDRVATQCNEDDELESSRTKYSTNPKTTVKFDVNEQENSESSPRSRPDNLGSHNLKASRKSTQWMEIHKPIIEATECDSKRHLSGCNDFRRHSVAVGMNSQTRTPGTIGINNVHYYEIPVSLMTSGAVAIVDPAFAGSENESDDAHSISTSMLSPMVSPTTPAKSPITPQEENNV